MGVTIILHILSTQLQITITTRKTGQLPGNSHLWLQIFAQCCWGCCDDQLYSPVQVGSDKLEYNACGQLFRNRNTPSD